MSISLMIVASFFVCRRVPCPGTDVTKSCAADGHYILLRTGCQVCVISSYDIAMCDILDAQVLERPKMPMLAYNSVQQT